MFQSTPGYEAGRFVTFRQTDMRKHEFQSTPGYEAGRFAGVLAVQVLVGDVSIHARL